MKKLELKHLVMYIPYFLKGYVNTRLVNVTGIDYSYELPICYETLDGSFNGRSGTKFLPILRPMSDLKKEIDDGEGKFFSMERLFGKDYWKTEGQLPDFIRHTENCAKGSIDPIFLPYWIVENLFEWQFDVFGLVEKGLAIYPDTIVVETNSECCCRCAGIGDVCKNGGAWIYCVLHDFLNDEFKNDCGETRGCNYFTQHPKIG